MKGSNLGRTGEPTSKKGFLYQSDLITHAEEICRTPLSSWTPSGVTRVEVTDVDDSAIISD